MPVGIGTRTANVEFSMQHPTAGTKERLQKRSICRRRRDDHQRKLQSEDRGASQSSDRNHSKIGRENRHNDPQGKADCDAATDSKGRCVVTQCISIQ